MNVGPPNEYPQYTQEMLDSHLYEAHGDGNRYAERYRKHVKSFPPHKPHRNIPPAEWENFCNAKIAQQTAGHSMLHNTIGDRRLLGSEERNDDEWCIPHTRTECVGTRGHESAHQREHARHMLYPAEWLIWDGRLCTCCYGSFTETTFKKRLGSLNQKLPVVTFTKAIPPLEKAILPEFGVTSPICKDCSKHWDACVIEWRWVERPVLEKEDIHDKDGYITGTKITRGRFKESHICTACDKLGPGPKARNDLVSKILNRNHVAVLCIKESMENSGADTQWMPDIEEIQCAHKRGCRKEPAKFHKPWNRHGHYCEDHLDEYLTATEKKDKKEWEKKNRKKAA